MLQLDANFFQFTYLYVAQDEKGYLCQQLDFP